MDGLHFEVEERFGADAGGGEMSAEFEADDAVQPCPRQQRECEHAGGELVETGTIPPRAEGLGDRGVGEWPIRLRAGARPASV